MSDSYFGDAVIYEGRSNISKFIRAFSKSPYTHCALRINEDTAESIDWDIKNRSQILIHDLKDPLDIYLSYKIYRLKGITPANRIALDVLNDWLPREYDPSLIIKLAANKVFKKRDSVENLANEGVFSCSSRMAFLYEMISYKIIKDLDASQTEPKHFTISPVCEEIEEWIRNPTESRADKVKRILPSYKSLRQLAQRK